MKKNMKCCVEQTVALNPSAQALYSTRPELKGAAVFSKSGCFAIVDRKRIAFSPDGQAVSPFERDGSIWLPMAPIAAGIAHAAVVDTQAGTLNFTYRRKKYEFCAAVDQMVVSGERVPLDFAPIAANGTLFFPLNFVKEFFHWRQSFLDPMGLVVLSNRKAIYDSARDEDLIWRLIADTSFVRPTGERIVDDLRRRFPNPTRGKLFASFDELMQLRRLAKSDAALGGYVSALKQTYGHNSDAFLRPAITADDGAKALKASADALLAFVMLFRVTGDKQYAERAAAEAEAIADLADWKRDDSWLLFSKVVFAMALTYDWCRYAWSEGRKAKLERSMLRNALRPMLEEYDAPDGMWHEGGFYAAVVNASTLALSLALSDIYPQTTYKLLERVVRNMEPCFAEVAPDGGNEISTVVWEQTARALGLTVAMLERACGTDYGFGEMPGFAATAYFPIYTETANGAWNYHGFAADAVDTSMQYFFAKYTKDDVLAWMRRQELLSGKKDVHPFDILFYTPVDDAMTPHLALDTVYRKAGLSVMRSNWHPDATVLGLHGGKNHLDACEKNAGAVLLEMGGERFFANAGKESPEQNADADVKIVEMRSSAARAYAVADMTSAFDAAVRAKRGVMLTENRSVVVIQDEITFAEPADFVWSAWTQANTKVSGSGRSAVLELNGKRMGCKLCGVGSPAKFELTEDENGWKCLTVRVPNKEKLRMAVVCRLLADGDRATEKVYDVVPMAKWGE